MLTCKNYTYQLESTLYAKTSKTKKAEANNEIKWTSVYQIWRKRGQTPYKYSQIHLLITIKIKRTTGPQTLSIKIPQKNLKKSSFLCSGQSVRHSWFIWHFLCMINHAECIWLFTLVRRSWKEAFRSCLSVVLFQSSSLKPTHSNHSEKTQNHHFNEIKRGPTLSIQLTAIPIATIDTMVRSVC